MDAFLSEVFAQRYNDLAKSIVIQAADDYKKYQFVLDTIEFRKYKDYEGKIKAINIAKREIKSVEKFFNSSWFYDLSNVDGRRAFIELKKTYVAEYYPVRMKELMDDTKQARFRNNGEKVCGYQ